MKLTIKGISYSIVFSDTLFAILQEDVLNQVLFDALVQDKDEFVLLMVDSGIDLKRFLTNRRLGELYETVSLINLVTCSVGCSKFPRTLYEAFSLTSYEAFAWSHFIRCRRYYCMLKRCASCRTSVAFLVNDIQRN